MGDVVMLFLLLLTTLPDEWSLFGVEQASTTFALFEENGDARNELDSGVPVTDFAVQYYGASWCPPCRQWKKKERKHVICRVHDADIDKASRPLESLPTFRLIRYDWTRKRWIEVQDENKNPVEWEGYTAAATINAEVRRRARTTKKRAIPKRSKPLIAVNAIGMDISIGAPNFTGRVPSILDRRRAKAELIDWITRRYTQGTATQSVEVSESGVPHQVDVSPRSDTWRHLINEHGFSAQQVNGIPLWQALALHTAAHDGLITPWK